MSKKKFYAVVVSVPEGDSRSAQIVTGSPFLVDDIDEAFSSRDASESLGDPPENGLWMWEGHMHTSRSYEGDYDVDYRGEYRRLTENEIKDLTAGKPIIEWDKGPPDGEDEVDPLGAINFVKPP